MSSSRGQERVRSRLSFGSSPGLVHDPAETSPQRIASFLLIVVTTIVTFLAAWYIYRELNRVKPAVIYERRKARYVHPSLSFIAFETHRRHAI